MKAIFFEKHGGPEVLKYADLPDPVVTEDHALVKVHAVALNHLDIWVREGWKGLQLEMPHITGCDISGELVEVKGQSDLKPGNRVIVNPGIVTAEDEWTLRGEDSISPGYRILGEHLRGGLADYVIVPRSNVFLLPDNISFEDGAAPLLVGTTCWRMLFKVGQLRPGESVLVVGAGGGVNSLAILMAKAAGACVISLTSGEEKMRKASQLGSDHVIDYVTVANWPAEVLKLTRGRGVDIVIDNVGAQTFSKSLRAVARGGRIVTVGNTSGHEIVFDNRLLFTKQVSLLGSTMGSRQDFADAMNFIWRHNLKVPIDRVEPLKEGIKMISHLEQGKQFGKIVLRPNS
jgi:NADPH:quinone reductase-like Zn-dependent oxidoreductase